MAQRRLAGAFPSIRRRDVAPDSQYEPELIFGHEQ
jgi:hypothetical protein